MVILELSCLAIIALYLGVRFYYEADRPRLARRMVLLISASWITENTVIHAYHFYQYSPRWSVFVNRVPLLVLIIWPIVIISAWDLWAALRGRGGVLTAFATACLVFADAYVMEPIAVESGLWSWNEPGLFRVPPIGVAGWSFFTFACLALYDQVTRRRLGGAWDLLVLVLPPVFTHLLLLATWWGFFRWVNHPISAWVAVGLAWALSLGVGAIALRSGAAKRVRRRDLMLRVPAAGFFFVLLGIYGRDRPALIAYAVAFSVPYLVLTFRARSGPHTSAES